MNQLANTALNAVAAAAPRWLRAVVPADWHARYDRRVENARLPESTAKREAYAVQAGADGYLLQDALDRPGTPAGTRGGREWVGYVAHLTETCDEHAPRLAVHADTTDAGVHEAMRTMPIHAALAAKGLAPSEHLADTACMGADPLTAARERYGIGLIGPQHRDRSWQGLVEGAFDVADFAVDRDERVARCPEGKRSASWASHRNSTRPHRDAFVQVRFRLADCRPCPSRARCTRSSTRGRHLNLSSRREHEALVGARLRQGTDAYRRLYAARQGVEGTMSQGVRAFGLRQARYRGLAKTALQRSTSRPPRPSTSIGSRPGSPDAHSHPRGCRASRPSQRDG
jgi:hypothetical protein